MSENLLSLIQKELSGPVLKQVGIAIGEEGDLIQKGMETVIPSMVGGLMTKTCTTEGAGAVLEMIRAGKYEAGVKVQLENWNGDQKVSNALMLMSEPIVSHIFGEKTSSIVHLISKKSGLNQENSHSLLTMTAPIVMGVIEKQVSGQKMNAAGVSSLMMGQNTFLKGKIPSGLTNALGIVNFDQMAENAHKIQAGIHSNQVSAVPENPDVPEDQSSHSGSWWNKALPIGIILLAAGAWAWNHYGPSLPASGIVGDQVNVAADGTSESGAVDAAAGETTGGTVALAENTATPAADGVTTFNLPGGENLSFKNGSFGLNLVSYLAGINPNGSNTFTFDNLVFQNGSAKIVEESMVQLNNLGTVLNAYPDADIRIERYTGPVNESEQRNGIAEERVAAVKSYLVQNLNIDEKRIATSIVDGTSSNATGNTDAETAQVNRTDLIVLQR